MSNYLEDGGVEEMESAELASDEIKNLEAIIDHLTKELATEKAKNEALLKQINEDRLAHIEEVTEYTGMDWREATS